jgi:hypothetical protein
VKGVERRASTRESPSDFTGSCLTASLSSDPPKTLPSRSHLSKGRVRIQGVDQYADRNPLPEVQEHQNEVRAAGPLDSDIITCFTCGHELGTLGSVKAKMLASFERMKKQALQRKQ